MKTTQKRVDAINEVHTLINNAVPKLRAALLEGFKLKADGTLYQADRDRLNAIIRESHNQDDPTLRVSINDNEYSIWLRVYTRYDNEGDHGNSYYEQNLFLYSHQNYNHNQPNSLERRSASVEDKLNDPQHPLLTLKKCHAAEVKARALMDKIQTLKGQHQKLVHDFKLLNQGEL